MAYDWPGNVRELENVIERAVVLCAEPRDRRRPDSGSRAAQPRSSRCPTFVMPPEGISLPRGHHRTRDASYIESALEAAGGVQKRAAELLHIKPTTLNEMIKRYDIRPRRKKAPGQRPDGRRSDDGGDADDRDEDVGAGRSRIVRRGRRRVAESVRRRVRRGAVRCRLPCRIGRGSRDPSLRSRRPALTAAAQPREHALVLAQDHVPAVVAVHVGACRCGPSPRAGRSATSSFSASMNSPRSA